MHTGLEQTSFCVIDSMQLLVLNRHSLACSPSMLTMKSFSSNSNTD